MNTQGSTIKEASISSIKDSTLTINRNITLDIPSSKNPSTTSNSLSKLPDSIAIDIDRQGQVTCSICLGDYPPEELKPPLKCKHAFCSACLTEYLNVKLNNNEVLDIPCPQSGCREIFPKKSVKKIIPSEEYKRYQALVTKKIMLRDRKNYCPQPGCSRPVKLVEGQEFTMCECGAKVCNACLKLFHEGKTCIEEIDSDFERYTKENGVRFCMMCKTIVIKETGCNHMKCAVCDYQWCWICGRESNANHWCPREWDPIPPASIRRKDGTLMYRFKKRWKEASVLKRIGICLGIFLLSPLLLIGCCIFYPAYDMGCLNLNTFEFERRKPIKSVCIILGALLFGLVVTKHNWPVDWSLLWLCLDFCCLCVFISFLVSDQAFPKETDQRTPKASTGDSLAFKRSRELCL